MPRWIKAEQHILSAVNRPKASSQMLNDKLLNASYTKTSTKQTNREQGLIGRHIQATNLTKKLTAFVDQQNIASQWPSSLIVILRKEANKPEGMPMSASDWFKVQFVKRKMRQKEFFGHELWKDPPKEGDYNREWMKVNKLNLKKQIKLQNGKSTHPGSLQRLNISSCINSKPICPFHERHPICPNTPHIPNPIKIRISRLQLPKRWQLFTWKFKMLLTKSIRLRWKAKFEMIFKKVANFVPRMRRFQLWADWIAWNRREEDLERYPK